MQSTLMMQQDMGFYQCLPTTSYDFSLIENIGSAENKAPQMSQHHRSNKNNKMIHNPPSDLDLEMQFGVTKKLQVKNNDKEYVAIQRKIPNGSEDNSYKKPTINFDENQEESDMVSVNQSLFVNANEAMMDFGKSTPSNFSNYYDSLNHHEFKPISLDGLSGNSSAQIPSGLDQLNAVTDINLLPLGYLHLLSNDFQAQYDSILEQSRFNSTASNALINEQQIDIGQYPESNFDFVESDETSQENNVPSIIGKELIQQKSEETVSLDESNAIQDVEEKALSNEEPAEKSAGKKRKTKISNPPAIPENKSPEGRRVNRWQAFKALQEEYLKEWQKPYVIDLHIDPINPNPKLKFTPIGQANQVQIPKLDLNRVQPIRNKFRSLWEPVNFDQESLVVLEEKIQTILKEKDINHEKIVRLLKKFNMNEDALIDELMKNIPSYKNYLKLGLKSQKRGNKRG